MSLTSLHIKPLLFSFISFLQDENAVEDIAESQIGPIIEPEPIAFSFNTLGWKIVGVLLLCLLAFVIYKLYKKYQKNAYKREAIKVLTELESQVNSQKSSSIAEQISAQLKRVAIISFGREEVAALSGTPWLAFLQEKGKHTPFLKFEDDMNNVIYSEKEMDSIKINEMLKLSIKWIKSHA